MSIRTEKVASLIKRVISKPINDIAMESEAGITTVTSVKMSPDLQIAKIYISSYGGKISTAELISILESRKGELRTYVGANVRLRFTPELRFFLDDTLDQMEHIQKLLDSINQKKSN